MFDTILIANRGEIACRVMRTLRRLGIRSVAVCSEADRGALFTRLADEVVEIGPAAARESYLRADRILEAARRTKAQAIHPGYGFLSENAPFAAQCAASGIRFIGPGPAAIAAMGMKDAAKALMERAGVPVVPGYHGHEQNPEALLQEAERIGFPVLIKAVAGGGGKGMRVVRARGEFQAALDAARREAHGAFGDDRVLIEKYLTRPRHIEVQVFADSFGNTLHLFERDCSIQRRHQKVVEEAPAPGMPPDMRARMGEAAVRAARAIQYEGAGTVEFIADVAHGLDPQRFYFMEMNTRLQVEHPVTEMITGLDLVEWQVRVAAGEKLPLTQSDVPMRGHAVEVRLYAEDPAQEFLPQTGTLAYWSVPEASANVRIDTGVAQGDHVGIFYDPMLAKLVAWGSDRAAALRELRRVLAGVEVLGVRTNLALLSKIAAHPAYLEADVHTGFLDQHQDELLPRDDEAVREAWLLACVGTLQARARRQGAAASADPWSPWNTRRAFQVNAEPVERVTLRADQEQRAFEVTHVPGGYRLRCEGTTYDVSAVRVENSRVTCMVNGRLLRGAYLEHGPSAYVQCGQLSLHLDLAGAAARVLEETETERVIKSPMPGKITAVLVSDGERVLKHAALVRLEAMKMEHTLRAKVDGVVSELSARLGEQVEAGSTLLVIRHAEEK